MELLWLIALIGVLFGGYEVHGSKLVDSILGTYERILQEVRGGESREGRITPEELVMLMNLIDNDTHCGKWCHMYLDKLLDGHNSIFTPIVDAIYGDMISDDPFEPQEIHLSLTGDSSEMKVMWVTGDLLVDPHVEYRRAETVDSPASKWQRSAAIHYTYEVPKKWWPVFEGVIYEADMTGLQQDSYFEYRVKGFDVVNSTQRASKDFSFKAAPVAGAEPERTTRISVMADQGTFMLLGFAAQQKLAAMQDELAIDFATVVGDLSYAGLSTEFPRLNISKEDEFSLVWDLYGIQSQAVAATRPWMVTNGNHERFYNFTAFRHRYSMPHEASGGSVDNFWYSYDYGNVHWISISSEHDLSEGSPQRTFLEKDLAAAANDARRAQVPWIVLGIHKPLYSSVDGTPGGYADLLEDIVVQYDVDLLVAGHMHAYERVHPVNKGEVTCYPEADGDVDVYHSEGKGPVYVVQGNAGGMQFETFVQPAPSWSAVRMANGFLPPNRTQEVLDSEGPPKCCFGGVVPDTECDGLDEHDCYYLPQCAWGFSKTCRGDVASFQRRDHDRVPEDYKYSNTFGFGVITAHNSTHMEYTSVPVTGSVGADTFYIVKRN